MPKARCGRRCQHESCKLGVRLYSGVASLEDIFTKNNDFYGGHDPRELPIYSVGSAAAYLRLSPATLKSWVVGRSYPKKGSRGYFRPLIRLPDRDERLSFYNLIEAHVLRALRTRHSVPLKKVRAAVDYAEKDLGIERLLISRELQTTGGDIFLEHYGQLIDLSLSGQLAMRKIFENYLRRVEWDDSALPARFYPFLGDEALDGARRIVIDPTMAFGRPIIVKRGISTAAVAGRVDAGESVQEIAADYGLDINEIEEALIYELAA